MPLAPDARRGLTWVRAELLLALRLYVRTPFGRLDSGNPDAAPVARMIGRTPGAVTMQALNLASCDPELQARGIRGLPNRGHEAERLWADFAADPEAVAAEAEAMRDRFESGDSPFEPPAGRKLPAPPTPPAGPSETVREVRARRVQRFFRGAVEASYEGRCALTGLSVPALLTASHIIPWAADRSRRADPRNGLLLNALHDRAFDRGLLTFDENLRTVLSRELKHADAPDFAVAALLKYEGRPLTPPKQFDPAADALAYHRKNIFAH